MFVPRGKGDMNIINLGSPSFESVEWSGNIHTSKFVITYEYQLENEKTLVAKGIYSYEGVKGNEIKFNWVTHTLPHLNEIYQKNGYKGRFGAR